MTSVEAVPATRRGLLLGICLVVGSTMVVSSTFTYMLTPMLADLGLTRDAASVALKVPSIAALVVVFVAGRLGDRLGHRRVITWMAVAFTAGSAMVLVAQDLPLVAVGLLVEGIGATAVQITVVGLLAASFVEAKERSDAFSTYGMVSPFMYLVFPLVAGYLATHGTWRQVAAVWVVAGLVMLLTARTMLPRAPRTAPLGEVVTPLAAGLLAVALVQGIDHITTFGLLSWQVLGAAALAVALALVLRWRLRRPPPASLSVAPLGQGSTVLLLAIVILVPLLNTWLYLTSGLQYIHGLTALQAAAALIPAQIGAILGAKLIAGRAMRRLGPVRAGGSLMLALAATMLLSVFAQVGAPLWPLLVYATLFGTVSTAVTVVLVTAVMAGAEPGEEGTTSAYRSAAASVGSALGVVLMSTVVFAAGHNELTSGLQDTGLSSEEATAVVEGVAANSASPELLADYSVPLPDGTDVSELEQRAMVAGMRANGLVGAGIALVGAGMFRLHRRRYPDE